MLVLGQSLGPRYKIGVELSGLVKGRIVPSYEDSCYKEKGLVLEVIIGERKNNMDLNSDSKMLNNIIEGILCFRIGEMNRKEDIVNFKGYYGADKGIGIESALYGPKGEILCMVHGVGLRRALERAGIPRRG